MIFKPKYKRRKISWVMIGNVNSACIDKPQLKAKAKGKAMAKSKAKAWAEVGYIITPRAVPSPSHACPRPAQSIHSLNHKSN